ncbi:MAG: S9 family peptidase, partial [Deltaproteobacteria bacterium]|nr:S9 family peptidase [Deltaproteobacteria bacterium]
MKRSVLVVAIVRINLILLLICTFALCFLSGCSNDSDRELSVTLTAADISMDPPVAEKREFSVVAPHGAQRQDDYYWLRDDQRQDQDILDYLNAENKYTDAAMSHLTGLKDSLYEELIGRLKQDDASVPYLYKDFWYYVRYEENNDYPIYARRKESMDAPEEVMLHVNELAQNHDYYKVANWSVSPDQNLLAYVVDTVGRRQYALYVKNLTTGQVIDTGVTGTSYDLAWAQDNQTIFYVWNNPDTLLSKSVKSHQLGTNAESDPVVYYEPDDIYYLSVELIRSEDYICILCESTLTSEQRCASAANPVDFRLIAARKQGVEYWADHLNDRWIVRTNEDAPN